MIFTLVVLQVFIFICDPASGQTPHIVINAVLDKNQVLIGEPVTLEVKVKTGQRYPVTSWINLPDSLNRLEVLRRSPVDSVLIADSIVYHQSFTITGFEPGEWSIPALKVAVGKKNIYSDSLMVTVMAVPLKDSTYHGIREIIEVSPPKEQWWYYLIGIVSLIVLGVLIVLWIKQRSGKRLLNKSGESGISPLDEALAKIKSLNAELQIGKEDWKSLYSELTDIFKVFVAKKFDISAKQKTTDELLMFLKKVVSTKEMQAIVEVMRISDAVKFAKYKPDRKRFDESVQIVETTLKMLDHLNG